MAEVLHVSDANFESEVVKSDLPVLVDFWAPWCGPCRAIAPTIEKLAAKYDGKVKICKMNTDESPETPGKLNIHGIPTLIIFKGGQEVDRQVGLVAEPVLAQKLDAQLG